MQEKTKSGAAPVDDLQSGFVLLGPDNQVVLATGHGRHNAIQALLADSARRSEFARNRLAALNLSGERLILLWFGLDQGHTLIVINSGAPDTVFEFVSSVDFAYDIFENLLSNPYDAMTVVDHKGLVRFISPIHEHFFRHEHGEAIGKRVEKIIENTRLHKIVETGKAEVGHVQRMQGVNRVVSRVPIMHDDRIVGAVGRIMFKGPQQLEELNQRINSLENEVAFYKRQADSLKRNKYNIDSILGESSRIAELKRDITRVASLDVPVLITGESGVGKELVAQSIHELSSRRGRTMIMVNAAALPATLVESELFGYSSGAFTGASQKGHLGKFEQADKSTLFLDEIGDMPLEVQAKLLRVLQDGSVEKLGGTKPIKVDFRLVTATNRDIEEMISRGEFRLDLYYRISPVIIRVPPLRERLQDIPILAESFLQGFAERHGRQACTLDPEAAQHLQTLPWKGNVRQLKHEVERAAIFDNTGTITRQDLLQLSNRELPTATESAFASPDLPLAMQIESLENEIIRQAMIKFNGNKKRVADELGISRTFLYKKLNERGLSAES